MTVSRRMRASAKWTGIVCCVVLATAWLATPWWTVGYSWRSRHVVSLRGGRFTWVNSKFVGSGAFAHRERFPRLDWDLAMNLSSITASPYIYAPILYLPLWIPLVATGAANLVWCHFVRRFPFGCCQRCGYNLTGLPEPRCPECGKPFEAKGDAP